VDGRWALELSFHMRKKNQFGNKNAEL